MNDFTDLVAVVTGGASGIGAATVRLLRARGARVAVLDAAAPDQAPDQAPGRAPDQGSDQAPDAGSDRGSGERPGDLPEVLAIRCDVTDRDAVDRAIDVAATRFGGIDVVVNNAGIGAVGDVSANDDDEWARVLDVNATGMARVARAALPHLRKSEHPVIVNTCSAVAFVGVRDRALYSASKGAVLGLTLAMAADHVGEGIRVNAVAPGTTETPWVGRLLDAADDPDGAAEALRARQPLQRLVTAEEVADAIVSLASPSAAATTGIVLRVDGGMTTLRV